MQNIELLFPYEVHFGCCPEKYLRIVHCDSAVPQQREIQGLLPREAGSAKPGAAAGFQVLEVFL